MKKSLAVLLVCLAPLDAAWAVDSLEVLSGKWTGSGWARQAAGSERESVRCRVTGTYRKDIDRLTLSGKCASPGRTGRIDGFVEPLDRPGRFTGRWSNPFGAGSTMVNGVSRDNTITFRYSVRDPKTEEKSNGIMLWTISPDRFVIASADADTAPPATLSEIEFSR
ncbi:hypothetical protein [Hoeflea poritis]|uniref:Lipocalin-like domain-containing protein n=1 Tax=Hoeflea poritis TaxID=2993659 RepID=A0ABT4VLF0_9HYPH|nr:hypothetical protein [Hoeflea poritis]MDA4845424.1 hypothetical protein [Hoeflea poritis]